MASVFLTSEHADESENLASADSDDAGRYIYGLVYTSKQR